LTEEEIKLLAEKISEYGVTLSVDTFIFSGVITLIAAGIGVFFTSYLKKNAELTAINENFDELKRQLTATTEITENIKGNIQSDIEQLKTSLSRHDHIFQYKLEAFKELNKMWFKLVPKKTSPEMDFDDACEVIGAGFSKHQDSLIDYLAEYAPALSKAVSKKLTTAMRAASDGQFEFYWNDSLNTYDLQSSGIQSAKDLYNALDEALTLLRREIDELITANQKGTA